MKSHKSTKKIVVLPPDFQEVVISNEMQLNKEISIQTLGMEYYDSINKKEFHQYYFEKSNKLLQNPTIIEVLETKNEDSKIEPSSNFGSGKKIAAVKRKSLSNVDLPVVNPNENEANKRKMMRAPTMKNFEVDPKNKIKNILGDKVHEEIKGLEEKLTKVNENIYYQLNDQKDKFEAMKKKKLERLHSPNKSYLAKNKQPVNNFEVHQEISIENVKIPKLIEQDSGQSNMLKEIEYFIEKNMNEMHKALEELKISFEDEINSMDESMFPDLVNGLKEDMELELENMKEQYEEQRRVEVEKIRTKYLKKK